MWPRTPILPLGTHFHITATKHQNHIWPSKVSQASSARFYTAPGSHTHTHTHTHTHLAETPPAGHTQLLQSAPHLLPPRSPAPGLPLSSPSWETACPQSRQPRCWTQSQWPAQGQWSQMPPGRCNTSMLHVYNHYIIIWPLISTGQEMHAACNLHCIL